MDLGMNQNSYKQVRIRREGGGLQDADRTGGLFWRVDRLYPWADAQAQDEPVRAFPDGREFYWIKEFGQVLGGAPGACPIKQAEQKSIAGWGCVEFV